MIMLELRCFVTVKMGIHKQDLSVMMNCILFVDWLKMVKMVFWIIKHIFS